MSRKELALMIVQAEEEKEALMLENKQKEAQLEEQKPKVVFADAILGSTSSCLVGELAKILTQNGYKIGQNQLFVWLRANHYLGVSGEYYNIPNQRYVEQGLFELKKNTHSENGVMKTTVTTKVTPKGQQYFINKFIAK
jgi:anti-repressor protein